MEDKRVKNAFPEVSVFRVHIAWQDMSKTICKSVKYILLVQL